MAKQMNYTDRTGTTHAQSYWKASLININAVNKRGEVVFFGYHDAAARGAGKAPFEQVKYDVTAELYQTYFAPDAQNPEGKNPFQAAYDMADALKYGPPPQPEQQVDENGFVSFVLPEDTRTSFFVGATDV